MKTKFYLPVIIALVTLSFTACKKENRGRHEFNNMPPTTINLNAIVKAGDSYKLNLDAYGGNGASSITKQASAYSVSKITVNESGNTVYEYVSSLNPKEGKNTDQVILKTISQYQVGGGCRNEGYSTVEKNITVNFTIE